MRMRAISWLSVFGLFAAACAASSAPSSVTRPAPVRTSEAPLFQGTSSGYTVTITVWAVDGVTREHIDGAEFLVVTIVGSYTFTDTFQISFPADTVLHVLARAQGYADQPVQIKPHYERNVQLEMNAQMFRPTPTPGGV